MIFGTKLAEISHKGACRALFYRFTEPVLDNRIDDCLLRMSSLLHCAPLGQTLSANTPKAIRITIRTLLVSNLSLVRRLKSFRYECSSTSVRKAYSGQAGLASDSFPFGPSRHQIEMIEKSLSTDLHRQHVSHSVRPTLTTFQGVALLSPPRTRIP